MIISNKTRVHVSTFTQPACQSANTGRGFWHKLLLSHHVRSIQLYFAVMPPEHHKWWHGKIVPHFQHQNGGAAPARFFPRALRSSFWDTAVEECHRWDQITANAMPFLYVTCGVPAQYMKT